MTLALALRSLAASPVRSAVLAAGFGFGVAIMAALLGVGAVVLEQARDPALAGGGDLVVYGATGELASARFVLSSVLGGPDLAARIEAASPALARTVYLLDGTRALPVRARGGVPSLERALGDRETAGVAGWDDTEADRRWAAPAPADVLRALDRFRPVPEGSPWSGSWAEWLYFNGRAGTTRFYLTFLAGPRRTDGHRECGVRLQLERDGVASSYSARAALDEATLVAAAPDIDVGPNRVRLAGLRYTIELDLEPEQPGGAPLAGTLTLDAEPGAAMPPLVLHGVRGWVSGYVVPVLAGALGGTLALGGETLVLDGGTGYHDHNWGFWDGVTWQWGQVAHGDVSLVYGRVRPPREAADPQRVPGVLAAFGQGTLLGATTAVTIEEHERADGTGPERIVIRGRPIGDATLDVVLDFTVEDTTRSRMRADAAFGPGSEFLQLRGTFRVAGTLGERRVDFAERGAAETFRLR